MAEQAENFPQPTLEERLAALENQCYVMYLQLNALTKMEIDKGSIDKDQLSKEMDELNKQLYDVTMEMMKGAPEAPAEAPAVAE